MGGQAGARGYVVQALVCVLDALRHDHGWTSLAVEPNETGEKIDILWIYPDRRRAVQVKSSQNQIGLPDVKRWAADLQQSTPADEYVLQLLGPCAKSVARATQIGAVAIAPPQPLNVDALVEQAAHKLGLYLEASGLTLSRAQAREMMALSLTGKLSNYSTSGRAVTREQFDAQLQTWARECGATTSRSEGSLDLPSAHQLPRPLSDLVGRAELLSDVLQRISSASVKAVSIWGMGGVGKTAFAHLLSDRLLTQYPDAQLAFTFVSRDENATPWQRAAVYVIQSLQPGARIPDGDDEILALYRSVLHAKRVLLLLDNATRPEQCEPLLRAGEAFCVITSRANLVLPDTLSVELAVLDDEDAILFLRSRCGRIGDHASNVARLCGNLPLALRLAASAIQQRSDLTPEEYVIRLMALEERLEFVQATITLSYDLLPRIQQRFWSILSLFPTSFTTDAAARITGADPTSTVEWLASLRNLSLVLRDEETGRYALHDLYNLFAFSRLTKSDGAAAARVFVEYYAKALSDAARKYNEGGNGIHQGLLLFDIEWANIVKAFALSARNAMVPQFGKICCKFPLVGPRLLEQRLRPSELLAWLQVSLTAAKRYRRSKVRAQLEYHIGQRLRDLGRTDEALAMLDIAHQRSVKIKEPRLTAATLASRAGIHARLGQTDIAWELAEQSREILAEGAIDDGRTSLLITQSFIMLLRGEWKRAEAFAREAAALAAADGNAFLEADALCNLGGALLRQKRYEELITVNERALAKAREVRYSSTEKDLLGNIGVGHLELGRAEEAIPLLEAQLSAAEDEGDRWSECNALLNLGRAMRAAGRRDKGVEVTLQALSLAQELRDPQIESIAQWNIGQHYEDVGDLNAAMTAAQRCAELQRQTGDAEITDTMARIARLERKMIALVREAQRWGAQ